MKNLRWSLLGLILYLIGLFCLERIGWGEPELALSAWINFWVSLVAVIVVLVFPAISRARPAIWITLFTLIFWGTHFGVYWIFPEVPVLGGIFTYITITQFILLMLAVRIAIHISIRLNEVNDLLQDILLGNANHQAQIREKAVVDIEREFLRSKRHHFPLSVMVIEPDPRSVNLNLNRSLKEIQQSMMARFLLSRLVHITSTLVRRTDLIINQPTDENNFIIFSPDITADQAVLLSRRIAATIEEQTGIKVHCGIATYPDEGLSFEDLVRIAQNRLEPENQQLAAELASYIKGDTQ